MADRTTAFDAYLQAGREGRPGAWRFLLGVALISVVYVVATLLASMATIAVALSFDQDGATAAWFQRGAFDDDMPERAQIAFLGAALIGLAATIPATAVALRLFHKRRLGGVMGAGRRLRLGDAAIGAAAAAITTAVVVPIAVWSGVLALEPRPITPFWVASAIVLGTLIVFQASAEEIVFRGYLLQWIGARVRSPIAWAVLPSLAFGSLHYSGADGAVAWLYVGLTVVFGLFAAALVWRTGGISVAIGYHIGNNLIALLLFDPPVGIGGIGLFELQISEDDLATLLAADAALLALVYVALSAIVKAETPAPPPPSTEATPNQEAPGPIAQQPDVGEP